ncbi:hypothetical protein MicloDRAFT_00014210 [Microvirga lotononidis]|uniref:Uncharacterized protein n=1 Tax=Microvirga lotononidis TaxID=864069 RepID=I4Z1K8_9HYPH|nr:hypothetical protein MicloDRAFT_00014210 [Microvirga lotononidis]
MSADRVAEVFRGLEEPSRSALLDRLDDETRLAVLRLLSSPPDSAGSIMTTEFVSVPTTWTVAQTLDHIRRDERTREGTVMSGWRPSGSILAQANACTPPMGNRTARARLIKCTLQKSAITGRTSWERTWTLSAKPCG